ncbi:hypothetical protein GW17_00006758 [Ensete ventricosum]|nr:hypothetical protein GW17_00006758 [Ensete ventricosum]
MRVRSGGTVSRKTISTVRWEEDTAVLLRQRQKAKGAPKSNGCHGSGQVSTAEEKQRPREIGHQKTIILTASGGPKSHPSSSFSLLHPAQSRPSVAENGAGGDEGPEEAVMGVAVVVVGGATCPSLPPVRSPTYRSASTGNTTWLKRFRKAS